ncbi:DUF6492 family protein [Methylobacterium oryzae]|uniref:DUF6492 family protein n=1 Tax=Methylobacterium oryzae TaxID=334852 RepID=UPI002F351734
MSALPSCSLLIRTYADDAQRLEFLLKSIDKYCKNLNEYVVVCRERCRPAIAPIVARHGQFTLSICPDYNFDYIGQQITKLRSHLYTKCDFVIHVDSDCIFVKHFDLSTYFFNGLPVLYHREYNYFYREKFEMPWQYITSKFLCRQVDFEFMALFPLIYPRRLYIDLEEWFNDTHGFGYENIESRLKIRHEFSEFNLLGAFSYYRPNEALPYHVHLNWGDCNPEHYVKQYCLSGERADRSVGSDEIAEIESMINL